MRLHLVSAVLLLAMSLAAFRSSAAQPSIPAEPPFPRISLSLVSTYETGVFDESAAEIVAHDPASQRLFVVDGGSGSIDILDVAVPTTPVLSATIPLSPTYGRAANSVAVANGIVAAAVEAQTKTDPGSVVFFDTDGTFLKQVVVGALPDMLTFTPDGTRVLVANEGEPNSYDQPDSVDPEGSVSIIDISAGVASATVQTVGFNAFNSGGPRAAELPADVRIFGPNATAAQDLEPEYIAVSPDSSTAFVTLQENNALAIINIADASVTAIKALGTKDHSVAGNGFDASDRDDAIFIVPHPVRGMYQPDAIAAYVVGGQTYLITANEGDAREYDGFEEEVRVGSKDYVLDTGVFTNAAVLTDSAELGRLTVTAVDGDSDGDGDYDAIYAFGARSFSIWNGSSGALVYDSGDAIERITAAAFPGDFNSTNDENDSFDNRSDNKGPEPEGVTLGQINGRTYAFIGLERIGGIIVYDVSTPAAPLFVQYINNRNFSGDAETGTAGDLGPEGLAFVPADESPTGMPLLIVANEVSGSTSIYAIEGRELFLPALYKEP